MTDSQENQKFQDINSLDPQRVIIYNKDIYTEGETHFYTETKICLLSLNDDSLYHKYHGFNKFSSNTYSRTFIDKTWEYKLDNDVLLKRYNSLYIDIVDPGPIPDCTFEQFVNNCTLDYKHRVTDTICNPEAKLFVPSDDYPLFEFMDKENYKIYKTLDNGNIGFIVVIDNKNNVNMYGRTKDVIPGYELYDDPMIFDNLIKNYQAEEIFIGKSIQNDMTMRSTCHGDKWDGNSILLQIPCNNENDNMYHYRYLHIGMDIFEFETDDKIIKYISSVGNNGVPYPYAESQNWCYCMNDCIKISVQDVPHRDHDGCLRINNDIQYSKMNITFIAEREFDNIKCEDENYDDSESSNLDDTI